MMNSDTSIVPREMMSLRGIPSIVINPEGIRISKIAYDTLGGKQRVLFRLNKNKRRLAVLRNEKLKDHSSDFLPEIEGWEPEFEKVTVVAESFNDFLSKIFTGEISLII